MCSSQVWIWLPKSAYPHNQTTAYSGFADPQSGNYTVAEFCKTYSFDKTVRSVQLCVSADTEFQLYCNGTFLATGPACVGGDFIGNETPREPFYATAIQMEPHAKCLDFFARVKMMPVRICEYSKGHGGFMLLAQVVFEDGSKTVVSTGEDWSVRYNGAYKAPLAFDGRVKPDAYVAAEITGNVWNAAVAPIPPRTEHTRIPEGCDKIVLKPHEEREIRVELDKIYAGFLTVAVKTKGVLHVEAACRETAGNPAETECLVFAENGEYRGFYLHSAGLMQLRLKNDSAFESEVSAGLITTHYPVDTEALTSTSDEKLNEVLSLCRHTLKYCRQTHHLDSPKHCEPLACTGDYYIETLMTAFSFADMRLARFDIVKTAQMLEANNGRMFHTTYSLIWVLWLYDVYLFTGDKTLLEESKTALEKLLSRFEGYIGENGLIETPPDYMFVDWIYIDDITMHHPPKALGQACLNLFYFGALNAAQKIYGVLGEEDKAAVCTAKQETLKKQINTLLFDADRGLYFEGLNTPTPEHLLGHWMPQNVEKRYYLKHSNILAACFGVCDTDTARELIRKILQEEWEASYQPYFAHWLLEAIYKNGLREEYTLHELEKWKLALEDCNKGLVEGFVAPEPAYEFDHSHAWGGTPLYSLPKALLGLEILEAGMKRIRLSPSLLQLSYADVELPTPYGTVKCVLRKGEKPCITAPKEIVVELK